ncbi:MAG: winged helix-turn-helix domain-containing protein, partial [Candidatus Binatia bacterium]
MQFRFDRFVFDSEDGGVTGGTRAVRLTPKSARLLRFLVERPRRLATKGELLDAVWPDTHVTDGVLKVCVNEIRRILGDDADVPRYLETVHGRGYRFIAEVSQGEAPAHARDPGRRGRSSGSAIATQPIVGREAELDRLGEYLRAALTGRRQLSFVTGEPGIGKSALVDVFLERAGVKDEVSVARGQCIEPYGAGEAYLPVLEALGRLCREEDGPRLIDLLRRYAPKWLAQMPWLLDAEERQRLERDLQGASQERM